MSMHDNREVNADDWPYVVDHGSMPECRYCGRELTHSAELLDDTCRRCFCARREWERQQSLLARGHVKSTADWHNYQRAERAVMGRS